MQVDLAHLRVLRVLGSLGAVNVEGDDGHAEKPEERD